MRLALQQVYLNGETNELIKNRFSIMVNYEKHMYELETLGFTIVENVYSQPLINDLKKQLDIALADDLKMFASHEGKKPDLVVDLSIHNPLFIKSLDNDIVLELCSRMLGANCTLYSFTSTILKPIIKSAVHNMHVDTNKYIKGYVTGLVMTVALDDFTEENGATYYLAGSQNSPITPSEETFVKYAQSTARKAGDVLFFNPRVFHRAGNNNSDKVRYGMTFYATPSFFKQRFDFPRMIPKDSLTGQSDRLLTFLGFNSRVPDSLENYYLPAEKRTYKA
jgi:ectoine hydroxylase-related dioxygenase (phytanoyl-CoA dioxygenase family)